MEDLSSAFGLTRGPGRIMFGPGMRKVLGRTVAALGRSALVCTDRRMAGDPLFHEALEDLRRNALLVEVFDGVEPELPAASVERCVADLADRTPDVVVGIGGGSCLDHAKVVALLLSHGGRVADYYGEFQVPGPITPMVAVPTTAGTGSEATPVAVLADPERAMKVGISSPFLIPHTAIVDPTFTVTCPPALTAHAAADALAHCVESFTAVRREVTPELPFERIFVGKSALSDRYALSGVELIAGGLPAVVADPADTDARRGLMLAALFGGMALSTGGTAAAHALQYPLGALTHTSHGIGVGVLLPFVMEFNRPARIPEFASLATALGIPTDGADENDRADAAIDGVADLLALAGIPGSLAELGLAADQLDWMAAQAMSATRLVANNPRDLSVETMKMITTAAFTGDRTSVRSTA